MLSFVLQWSPSDEEEIMKSCIIAAHLCQAMDSEKCRVHSYSALNVQTVWKHFNININCYLKSDVTKLHKEMLVAVFRSVGFLLHLNKIK